MCAGLPMNVISIILALQTFCAVLFSVCPMHVCLFVHASYTVYAVLFLCSACILSVYYHFILVFCLYTVLRVFPQTIPKVCRDHGLARQYLHGPEYNSVKERINIETSSE